MKNHLLASDLEKHILSEIEISFSGMPAYEEDVEPVPRASKKAELLSVQDIKQQFGVSDDVAAKLVSYQQDMLAEFHDAIGRMAEKAERYLQVKRFLNNNKYDISELTEYVEQNTPMKDLNARRYIARSSLGVVISVSLLAVIVMVTRNHWLGVSIDTLGGWILAIIWGGLTLLAALAIPKGYRTRKLLVSIISSS